mmetsp:Transcript_55554/g.81659  ORF Transcript_55554/g.81659 Transcript_55554/m.81659 type:complete len:269 (-) Transcript_55554:232-1038(-)
MSREEPLAANIGQPSDFSQGQSQEFGAASGDAYGDKGLASGGMAPGGDSSSRTVPLTLAGKTIVLSLHQPIYRNMQDKPAIFFKMMNVVVSLLLCVSGLYRLVAGFWGHIVDVRCKSETFELPVLTNSTIACKDILPFVTVSPDGFELFVQSCFVTAFTVINVLEEFDYKRVASIMEPYLSFMSNLLFRGLYLLFLASLIMTASHSFLLFTGALTMTTAFLYMILWGLSHHTSHGSKLGVQNYDTRVPDDFEAPLPANLQAQTQQVAT